MLALWEFPDPFHSVLSKFQDLLQSQANWGNVENGVPVLNPRSHWLPVSCVISLNRPLLVCRPLVFQGWSCLWFSLPRLNKKLFFTGDNKSKTKGPLSILITLDFPLFLSADWKHVFISCKAFPKSILSKPVNSELWLFQQWKQLTMDISCVR